MSFESGKQRGFTIVEALVATAIFGLLMVGIFSMYASNSSVFNRSLGKAETHQNARIALDSLTRELRTAGYDLSGVIDGLSDPTPIQVAESGRIVFVTDVDRDGALDQIAYQLSSGEMRRQISSWDGSGFPTPSSSVLANDVASLNFEYLDDSLPNNILATPVASSNLDDIRRVTVTVVTSTTIAGEQQTFPLFSDVRLRN